MANFVGVIYIHESSTSGVLSQNDYLNLVQCETLEDLKLHLQSTDYGNFLASASSLQVKRIFISHLSFYHPLCFSPFLLKPHCIGKSQIISQVSVIDEKLRDKLVTEFQHMRNHATGPLACFLDYIT